MAEMRVNDPAAQWEPFMGSSAIDLGSQAERPAVLPFSAAQPLERDGAWQGEA